MIKVEYPFIYISTKKNLLVFETRDYVETSTKRKIITQVYYGKFDDKLFSHDTSSLIPNGSGDDYCNVGLVTSSFGNGNNLEPAILLENYDKTPTNRFFFKEAKVLNESPISVGPHARKPLEVLDIVEVDVVSELELHTYYSTFDGSDVISVCKKLVNNSKNECHIKRLYSMEMPIQSRQLKVYSYDGAWLYERSRHETILESGTYKINSFVGFSSHKHNPYFEIHDENRKEWHAFNFIYSGSHTETVEVNPVGIAKVMVGINDFAFDYLLKANESFITPEAITCLAESSDALTSEMHKFVLAHVVNPNFAHKTRPILFNSWEGCYFHIKEETMLESARIAKDVGIELIVMDDGWFLNRVDDYRALGDWVVDPIKFPKGLGDLSNKIHDLGLQFGIWFEPEMISKDSEIYRTHPEYAMEIPGREPLERRQQLLIDMSNPDVLDYLYNCISKVIDDCKLDYIKWDFNRFMSDIYSSYGTRPGELMYRFMYGTYSLLERLTSNYPNILFNCCSSGGGRFDLGMLYYMPESQGSDDTNAYLRSFIMPGTLKGYPISTYGAHVSIDGCPIDEEGHTSSWEDRFNLHCASSFGYEMDLRKNTKEELEIFKNQTEFFKEHRELLQFGNYYENVSPFDDKSYYSFSVVSDNKDEAIVFIGELTEGLNGRTWCIKGLDPEVNYKINVRKEADLATPFIDGRVVSGKELMNVGIDLVSISKIKNNPKFRGMKSLLLYLKKQ